MTSVLPILAITRRPALALTCALTTLRHAGCVEESTADVDAYINDEFLSGWAALQF
jgi:hypothetical protein